MCKNWAREGRKKKKKGPTDWDLKYFGRFLLGVFLNTLLNGPKEKDFFWLRMFHHQEHVPTFSNSFYSISTDFLASEMSLGSYITLAVDTAVKSHPPLLNVRQNIYFNGAAWAIFIHNWISSLLLGLFTDHPFNTLSHRIQGAAGRHTLKNLLKTQHK